MNIRVGGSDLPQSWAVVGGIILAYLNYHFKTWQSPGSCQTGVPGAEPGRIKLSQSLYNLAINPYLFSSLSLLED